MRPAARSIFLVLVFGLVSINSTQAADVEPAHAGNDLYQVLLRDGLTVDGTRIAFPAPLLHDGDPPAVEQSTLRKLAAFENRDLQEMLRKSETADFVIKIRDEKAGDGTIVRIAHVWFVVHAGLDAFDPSRNSGRKGDEKPVEAANMRFATKLLTDDELKARKIARADPSLEWFAHLSADILDRIKADATDRVRATRSEGSWAFATRTDPRFDEDPQFPNRWWAIDRATGKVEEKPRHFAGGASITKISRLASVPGALMVESHFAFAEPHAWFDGAPTLRSKFAPVAREQIRRLRRELAKQQSQTQERPKS
jgi:hypothetical protein